MRHFCVRISTTGNGWLEIGGCHVLMPEFCINLTGQRKANAA